MSLKCPLCGFVFEAEKCHLDCPLVSQCGKICCPNCGYGMVEESSLVKLWRKLKLQRMGDVGKKHR